MPEERRRKINGRAHQRFPTSFEAWIGRHGLYLPAQVADVSVRGARIILLHQAITLAIGEQVTLRAHGCELDATVVRRSPDGYGLHFLSDIAPLQLVRENYAPLSRLKSRRPAAGTPPGPGETSLSACKG
ncbi:PilZ domain-containing protein [Sphingomonas sp. MA1305]|uniref:PilZ domain-containing protein n=1 Tax=Sphingomonas sp. MA1305 TaxID=2479204 RepID=UPI0018DFBEA9|nr:PilZ domain-containing protein [Sphingomonas sp. MA1305]MBI0476124.1 PilZ domain-containing protein [Sphingomonas sp. MA1305]